MPRRIPWSWGHLGRGLSSDQGVMYLNQRMYDLEQYLRLLHDDVAFGPVAGAYIVVPLSRSSESGALPTGALDLFTFDFEFRPIQVNLVCFGGNVTADIESESSSILSAGSVAVIAGTGTSLNARGDFAVEKVTTDLTLHNDSNDTGTPVHLRASVIGKNVSRVEPT